MDSRRCFFLVHGETPGQYVDHFIEREEGLQFSVINGGWTGLLTDDGVIYVDTRNAPLDTGVRLAYIDIPANESGAYEEAFAYVFANPDKLVYIAPDAALLLVKPEPKSFFAGKNADFTDDDIPF